MERVSIVDLISKPCRNELHQIRMVLQQSQFVPNCLKATNEMLSMWNLKLAIGDPRHGIPRISTCLLAMNAQTGVGTTSEIIASVAQKPPQRDAILGID